MIEENTKNLLERSNLSWFMGNFHMMGLGFRSVTDLNFLFVSLRMPYRTHDIKPSDVNLFLLFDTDELKRLRDDKTTYLFFDYTREGTAHDYYDFYELLYNSADLSGVPPHKIIFSSSNLLEQESYDEWALANGKQEKIHVLPVNAWDLDVSKHTKPKTINLDDVVVGLRKNLGAEKFFLNLNRRSRFLRTFFLYQLFTSEVWGNGLISADALTPREKNVLQHYMRRYHGHEFDDHIFDSFLSRCPLVLDREDFEVNWADTYPSELFNKTIFSVVNETIVDDHEDGEGISLFYSEKTFKPMIFLQPLMIVGKAGSNTRLKELGYNTYDKYFDLSFDSIPDTVPRISGIIREIERVVRIIKPLDTEGKIEWLLQDRETLLRNRQVIHDQGFNVSQVQNLVKKLNGT